jgi:hypothetical protein
MKEKMNLLRLSKNELRDLRAGERAAACCCSCPFGDLGGSSTECNAFSNYETGSYVCACLYADLGGCSTEADAFSPE